MNTTSFFVELIVIGVGAAIWIGLAVLSLVGISWVSSTSFSGQLGFVLLIPTLSIIYVLGIIIDRTADWILGPWSRALQRREFPNPKEYYRARTTIYMKSEVLRDLYEYGRSRLRICRGWALNALLILIAFDIFAARHVSIDRRGPLWTAGTMGFGLLAVAALGTWHGLVVQELARLREQFTLLVSEKD
jgi:hypothetical protein